MEVTWMSLTQSLIRWFQVTGERKRELVAIVGQGSDAGVSTLGETGSLPVTETEAEPIKGTQPFSVSTNALAED